MTRMLSFLLSPDGALRQRPIRRALLIVLFGIAIAFAALSPCTRAQWGPIDDHEIVTYLGPGHEMSLRDLGTAFMKTEGGKPGDFSRYRPSYYFLRLVETKLWGSHPERWYWARLFMFAGALAALLFILRDRLTFLENLCFVTYLATYRFWSDMLARLGPSEVYALVGLPLFAIGFMRCLTRSKVSGEGGRLGPALLLMGGVITVGAKENFLILVVPILFLLFRRFDLPTRLAALLLFLFTASVAIAVVIGIHQHGHVYAEDVSPGGRLQVLLVGARALFKRRRPWVLAIVGAQALTIVLAWVRDGRARAKALAESAARPFFGMLLLAGVFLSQFAFYNGKWPRGNRYDFPGALALPLILYIAYATVTANLSALRLDGRVGALARLVAVVVLALTVYQTGFPERAVCAEAAATTRAFTANMRALAAACRENPDWPLVFRSHHVSDYEYMYSTQQFLRYYGAEPTTYLRLDYGPGSFGAGSLERQLAQTLTDISQKGARGAGAADWRFHRLDEFRGAPCYSLGFSGAALEECTALPH